jgi:uncharacterized protein
MNFDSGSASSSVTRVAAKQHRPRSEDVPPPETPVAGYLQLVRGDPLRGRLLRHTETPEANVGGQV